MHEQSKIISIHKNMIIRITIRNSRIIIDIVRIYYANAAACILLYFCIIDRDDSKTADWSAEKKCLWADYKGLFQTNRLWACK